MPVLERYFNAMREHDWEALSACLSAGVHRTGPYFDVVEGRDAYTKFLSEIIPSLKNYSLSIRRITALEGNSAMVELSEYIDLAGVSTETREVLLFEFDEEGLIARVDIYIKYQAPKAL